VPLTILAITYVISIAVISNCNGENGATNLQQHSKSSNDTTPANAPWHVEKTRTEVKSSTPSIMRGGCPCFTTQMPFLARHVLPHVAGAKICQTVSLWIFVYAEGKKCPTYWISP